jgi:hypothetical protein
VLPVHAEQVRSLVGVPATSTRVPAAQSVHAVQLAAFVPAA